MDDLMIKFFLKKRNELNSIKEMKDFINSDLKDYNKHKDLVDIRK